MSRAYQYGFIVLIGLVLAISLNLLLDAGCSQGVITSHGKTCVN